MLDSIRDVSRKSQYRIWNQRIGSVHKICSTMDAALKIVRAQKKGKPGSKSEAIDILVDHLTGIFIHYNGQKISRGNIFSRYIAGALKLADPKILEGTIEAAIKRATSRYPEPEQTPAASFAMTNSGMKHSYDDRPLHDQLGISYQLEKKLHSVGIMTMHDLVDIGAIEAARRLQKLNGKKLSLRHLYSFEGAIAGLHWHDFSEEEKSIIRARAGLTA